MRLTKILAVALGVALMATAEAKKIAPPPALVMVFCGNLDMETVAITHPSVAEITPDRILKVKLSDKSTFIRYLLLGEDCVFISPEDAAKEAAENTTGDNNNNDPPNSGRILASKRYGLRLFRDHRRD